MSPRRGEDGRPACSVCGVSPVYPDPEFEQHFCHEHCPGHSFEQIGAETFCTICGMKDDWDDSQIGGE